MVTETIPENGIKVMPEEFSDSFLADTGRYRESPVLICPVRGNK